MERFNPPPAGLLLGKLVDIFRLRETPTGQNSLQGSTAQRFFRGERVSDSNRSELMKSIAGALSESGIFSFLESPERADILPRVVGFLVTLHVTAWDAMSGTMRSFSCPVHNHAAASLAYLRLGVLDLSLRVAAMSLLLNVEIPERRLPAWADRSGRSAILKGWLSACGDRRPTRDELSRKLGYSLTSIDGWLDGRTTPSTRGIADLASLFSKLLSTEERVLDAQLKSHSVLWDMCEALGGVIGWDGVEYLGEGLQRFVKFLREELRPYASARLIIVPGAELFDLKVLLVEGTLAPSAQFLFERLLDEEADRIWRADIQAATHDWPARLQEVARALTLADSPECIDRIVAECGVPRGEAAEMARVAAFMAQADWTTLPRKEVEAIRSGARHCVVIKGDGAWSARNRFVQADACSGRGDLDGAVVHLRRAVELCPTDHECQYKLGAVLGQIAHLKRPENWHELKREALEHLHMAAALRPEWDRPRAEIGVVLANLGEPEKAREYLREAVLAVPMTDFLAYVLGSVHLQLEQVGEALMWFRKVLELCPENADAMDLAAHCCFLLGHEQEGRALAKQAAHLGSPRTYSAWRAGRFRNPER